MLSQDAQNYSDVAFRSLIRHLPTLAPALVATLDKTTDAMIAEGQLPLKGIEAMHDLGHFLVRAAEEMLAARDRRAEIDSGVA